MNYEEFMASQEEKIAGLTANITQETPESLAEKVRAIVLAQAEYGKKQYDKKQAQIHKFEEVLEAIGYSKEESPSVREFAERFKEKSTTITQTEDTNKVLQERIARLEAEDAERKRVADELKAKDVYNTLYNELNETIGKKLKGSKYIIKDLISEGRVKLVDGKPMFAEGDNVILFEKGIEKVLEDNKDLVIAVQNSGLGTSRGEPRQHSSAALTLERINKMTPEELKANMPEIKKMAGIR